MKGLKEAIRSKFIDNNILSDDEMNEAIIAVADALEIYGEQTYQDGTRSRSVCIEGSRILRHDVTEILYDNSSTDEP